MPGLYCDASAATTILVLADSVGPCAIAKQLIEQLTSVGLHAQHVSVAEGLASENTRLVYLEAMTLEGERASETEFFALNQQAFSLARRFAQTIERNGSADSFILTLHNSLGSAEHALSSGLSALIKTASKEWSDQSTQESEYNSLGLKTIDIQWCAEASIAASKIAEMLAHELIGGGSATEVVYDTDGQRHEIISPKIDIKNRSVKTGSHITAADVWIVSGGLKGVTADCLFAAANNTPLKLAILARSEMAKETAATAGITDDAALKQALLAQSKVEGRVITPIELKTQVNKIYSIREMQHNLARLQTAGAELSYFPCDITCATAVGDIVEQVRSQWGPIKGLIHGAGVLADKLIKDKTDEQFERVFNTKVQGFLNLLKATSNDPLNVICCFSSVAARTGNVGQVDYAMANEVLNKLCTHEQRSRHAMGKTCVVKSINWGPWDGGMVSDQLKNHFASQGIDLLPVDAGAKAFVDELADDTGGPVEVVIGGSLENWASSKAPSDIEQKLNFDLYSHQRYQPWLMSHQIKEQVVVPMMMASEWFLRLATAVLESNEVELLNLKVIKGIVLKDFCGAGQWFRVSVVGATEQLQLQLQDNRGQVYYSATARIHNNPSAVVERKENSGDCDWTIDSIYPRCLFHGEDFQVIRELTQRSKKYAEAQLQHDHRFAGATQQWCSDVALLDGGVQLAVLWAMQECDKDSLPVGYSRLRVFSAGEIHDPVRAHFALAQSDTFKTQGDLYLCDEAGRVLLQVEGLEISTGTHKLIFRERVGVN